MSQSDSPPVLDPTRIAIPPDICAYLTTLLHQTLACTVELRSHVTQGAWDAQGKDVFLLQIVYAAMIAALDAYTDLVAARLVVLGGGARHGAHGSPGVDATGVSCRPPGGLRPCARAAEVEDAGSAALYTDLSRGVDQQLGVLDAHLHR